MKNVKRIAVVGAGTAGLVTALILKSRFGVSVDIDVIRSKNIGIVGVGEGSTEHWVEFMRFVGIDHNELIRECDCTYKLGIMFRGWAEKDYFHSVQSEYDFKYGQYAATYGSIIGAGKPPSSMSVKSVWDNKVNTWFTEDPSRMLGNQFHFNTVKLNDYLTKKGIEKGINFIEDEIKSVELSSDGYIKSVKSDVAEYSSDFFIDSTGFRKILISALGGKWESYSKYLKMNSAITFQTPDEENYNTYTVAQAMDAGWMFRLPVWGRYGNGYIFDKNYITEEQAKAEVEKFFGFEVNVGKTFNFDPGCLEKSWINNCVAVGLSSSFIEPLEATSIGSSIQQSFLLMHRLANYDQDVIDSYNASYTTIMHNIRDFVALHYVTKKDNTQFWKDIQQMPLPPFLEEKLKLWKNRLPISEDFINQSNYSLFGPSNYTLCLQGLGLFDSKSILQEFELLNSGLKNHVRNSHDNYLALQPTLQYITHKEYIRKIRES